MGEKVSTKVTNVVDFGLFVELADGLEGLVHISDFSWAPLTETPQDLYQVGQEIEVMVLDIDTERGRANLGIKQLQEDETSTQILEYTVGQVLDIKVTGIQSYGVFAELTPGLEGMIHISELGEDGEDPGALLSLNDVVRVEITAIDVDEKRLAYVVHSTVKSVQISSRQQPPVMPTKMRLRMSPSTTSPVRLRMAWSRRTRLLNPLPMRTPRQHRMTLRTRVQPPLNPMAKMVPTLPQMPVTLKPRLIRRQKMAKPRRTRLQEKTLRTTVLSGLAKNALGTSRMHGGLSGAFRYRSLGE